MACLRVVRLLRSGAGMFSQLAMCIPISDGRVRIVKVDYDDICSTATLTTAAVFNVDVKTMQSKAHVLAAVEDDITALRALLPEYEEVARECHAPAWRAAARSFFKACPHLLQMFEALQMKLTMARDLLSMTEHPKYRSLNPKATPQDLAVEQTSAEDLLLAFNQTPKSGDQQVDRRIASIKANCKPFRKCSQSLMPTSYIKKQIKLDGMEVRRSHTRMYRSHARLRVGCMRRSLTSTTRQSRTK
jgi:hypothetical protein